MTSPHPIPHETAAAAYPPAADMDLDAVIARAEKPIPPLWTLRNFVAVNPWLGLTDQPFTQALYTIQRYYHAHGVMPLDWYEQAWQAGRIDDRDLEMATADLVAISEHPLTTVQSLSHHHATPVLTFSEALDQHLGTQWDARVREEITKFCAARFDVGQAAWQLPWRELAIWPAWQAMQRLDRALELRGLTAMRAYVERLPTEPRQVVAAVLEQLGVAPDDWQHYLTRALTSIAGWAGHLQYHRHEARLHGHTPDDSLTHLLAIRLAYDGALYHNFAGTDPALTDWRSRAGFAETDPRSLAPTAQMLWQFALEHRFRRPHQHQHCKPFFASMSARNAFAAISKPSHWKFKRLVLLAFLVSPSSWFGSAIRSVPHVARCC